MENIYTKINSLFQEYMLAAALENTENVRLSIEQKLISAVWESNSIYKEYSVEVIEKVKESLVAFPKSEACRNGGQFSKYVCRAIANAINSDKEREVLERNNGGMHIPDNVLKEIRKIRNLRKNLQRFSPDVDISADMLVEKAVATLGMDEKDVRSLLEIASSATTGLDTPINKESGSVSLKDVIPDEQPSFADGLIRQDTLRSFFMLIDEHWKKKSDPMLSELLTVFVLENCSDLEKEHLNHAFFDRKILDAYFGDSDNELPEYQDIAEKYGQTKSAASKTLSRFWENIKRTVSIKEN